MRVCELEPNLISRSSDMLLIFKLGLHLRVKGAVSLKVALQQYGVIIDDDADGTNLVDFLRLMLWLKTV